MKPQKTPIADKQSDAAFVEKLPNQRVEIAEAALHGIREYLRSNRGVRSCGPATSTLNMEKLTIEVGCFDPKGNPFWVFLAVEATTLMPK